MAERQIVFRWIRQNIAAILAALTLSALSVTALTAGSLTVDSITAGDSALDVTAGAEEAITLAAGTIGLDTSGTFTLEMGVPGHLSTLTCNNGGCSFASAQTDTTYGVTVGTGSDVSSLDVVDTGITLGATGAASNVYLSWADAALSSVFRLDDDPDLTSTGAISVTGDSVTMSTAGGTGDINLLSDNDISIQWGGNDSLTLTADAAAFDVPVSAPVVAGGAAARFSQRIGANYSNFTPSAAGAYELVGAFDVPGGSISEVGTGFDVSINALTAANTNTKQVKLTYSAPPCSCASSALSSTLTIADATRTQGTFTYELRRRDGSTMEPFARSMFSANHATGGTPEVRTTTDSGAHAWTFANDYQVCICVQAATTNTDITIQGWRAVLN